MSRRLRSTLITSASPLLRAGPPARTASVLSASRFLPLDALPLAPGPHRRLPGRSIDAHFPTFHVEAADQARAAFTPDTAWPVSGFPPGSSRRYAHTPVLMSSIIFRRFINGSLSLAFLVPA